MNPRSWSILGGKELPGLAAHPGLTSKAVAGPGPSPLGVAPGSETAPILVMAGAASTEVAIVLDPMPARVVSEVTRQVLLAAVVAAAAATCMESCTAIVAAADPPVIHAPAHLAHPAVNFERKRGPALRARRLLRCPARTCLWQTFTPSRTRLGSTPLRALPLTPP
jgi:hypothetical protein